MSQTTQLMIYMISMFLFAVGAVVFINFPRWKEKWKNRDFTGW